MSRQEVGTFVLAFIWHNLQDRNAKVILNLIEYIDTCSKTD